MSLGNSTAEFGQAAAQWQKLVSNSWGQWAKSTVSSESFAAASGAYMDWTLSTQKMMAEMSGQVMETLDMPRRSDLARLAAQVQSVETRLLDQEEANEEIRSLLVSLNAKLDKMSAPTPAPSPAPSARSASSTGAGSNGSYSHDSASSLAPTETGVGAMENAAVATIAASIDADTVKEAVTQAIDNVEVLKAAPRAARKPSNKKGKK